MEFSTLRSKIHALQNLIIIENYYHCDHGLSKFFFKQIFFHRKKFNFVKLAYPFTDHKFPESKLLIPTYEIQVGGNITWYYFEVGIVVKTDSYQLELLIEPRATGTPVGEGEVAHPY